MITIPGDLHVPRVVRGFVPNGNGVVVRGSGKPGRGAGTEAGMEDAVVVACVGGGRLMEVVSGGREIYNKRIGLYRRPTIGQRQWRKGRSIMVI
jgi:hypothetical protein